MLLDMSLMTISFFSKTVNRCVQHSPNAAVWCKTLDFLSSEIWPCNSLELNSNDYTRVLALQIWSTESQRVQPTMEYPQRQLILKLWFHVKIKLLGSVNARHSSSGCQPNFVALNRGRHLYSARRPSR